MMIKPGDVISYLEMCRSEGASLQRGMNFRLCGKMSVILMSLRRGAPYADKIEEDGQILIYEGHNIAKRRGGVDPKHTDQPMRHTGGLLTQNGLFYYAAINYRKKGKDAEYVKVYEKLRPGIWVFNGIFRLVDAWLEKINNRKVFRFKLELANNVAHRKGTTDELEHNRLIPTSVKLEVWRRDKGRCVICGSENNLHFDHIIPYSKGGSSLVAENIQLLCARHNIAKRNKIE